MCYELIISTDYPVDLAKFNQMDVYFEQTVDEENKVNLKYEMVYRLATYSPGCCSCGFRIFDPKAFDYEFVGLQDWLEEEIDDGGIINTKFLFQIIKNLVNDNYKFDSYVVWSGEEKSPPIKTVIVNVNQVLKTEFVLFEDVYFNYVK